MDGKSAGNFAIKRIYDEPADDDGCRVLVDRLWPRGVSKERAQLELWLKDVAPSPPLRKEFGAHAGTVRGLPGGLRSGARIQPGRADTLGTSRPEHGKVTLLFGARDPETNHARVLQEFLSGRNSRK